jgi:hypothetical protein
MPSPSCSPQLQIANAASPSATAPSAAAPSPAAPSAYAPSAATALRPVVAPGTPVPPVRCCPLPRLFLVSTVDGASRLMQPLLPSPVGPHCCVLLSATVATATIILTMLLLLPLVTTALLLPLVTTASCRHRCPLPEATSVATAIALCPPLPPSLFLCSHLLSSAAAVVN